MRRTAIRDVIRRTEPFATVLVNGRAMTMGMGYVRCIVTPAKGQGTALRTYLREFRGVHKAHLHLYVATYEALLNTKQVTAVLIRRMCFGDLSVHASYT